MWKYGKLGEYKDVKGSERQKKKRMEHEGMYKQRM